MAKINIVTKNVHVDKLPYVLLLVIAGESSVLELGPYLSHLFVNSLLLLVLSLAVSYISDEE